MSIGCPRYDKLDFNSLRRGCPRYNKFDFNSLRRTSIFSETIFLILLANEYSCIILCVCLGLQLL